MKIPLYVVGLLLALILGVVTGVPVFFASAGCFALAGAQRPKRPQRREIPEGPPYRGAKNKRRPGQILKRWEGGPCSKHKALTACGYCDGDRARNRNIDAVANPRIEDGIDAVVAAWKTVYGEDIGYNEHSATLAKLGAWHTANDLTSDQLADCADNVEWITWALKQPNASDAEVAALGEPPPIATRSDTVRAGRRKLSHLADEPSVLGRKGCGCPHGECPHDACERLRPVGARSNSLRDRRIKRESTLEQVTRKLADLEARAAHILAVRTPADASKYLAYIAPMVDDLLRQRRAALDYAKSVDRFTALARSTTHLSASGAIAQADKRVSLAEARGGRVPLSEFGGLPCEGCAIDTLVVGQRPVQFAYCDGSHARTIADGVVSIRQAT